MVLKLLTLLGLVSVGLMAAIVLHSLLEGENAIRDVCDKFRRLEWVNKFAILFFVAQLTMFGGAKHCSTNDVDDTTGDVRTLMGMRRPLTSNRMSLPNSELPYRLESVSTNEVYSYAMPNDAIVHGTWQLTGAYEDVQRIPLDGFAFPLGSNLCTSLWVHTWGKVRPKLKSVTNEIAAIGAPMSVIPQVSRFWTAATSNDTILLTWENFVAGRAPLTNNNEQVSTLSAQIELWRNGDFITRSNEVESVWRRRLPCDLDEDGWIDSVDSNPMEFDVGGYGLHQALPIGDNTNYYYWVDLVVEQANARVTFKGNGYSTLPDPDFIARAGDTNRVMLLIGKSYVVHCDLPIRCVGTEDNEIQVTEMGRELFIHWPIYFDFISPEPRMLFASSHMGDQFNGGGNTEVLIRPERANGGEISWPNNFCCYATAPDGTPIFCCDGNCGCGGCYTGDITYQIGGHELVYGGWSCGCLSEPDDPHDREEETDDVPAGPSVLASFSQDAIIFEDEYENMPGVFIPRRSTEVEAEFYVYGGTNGGSYAFMLINGGKLQRLGGSYVPRNGTVRAGEAFHVKVSYDAVAASSSEGDIKAKAEFTENGTGTKISHTAELTAVKVELLAEANAPANECEHRHVFGVGEHFSVNTVPRGVAQAIIQGYESRSDCLNIVAPLLASVNPLKVVVDEVEYVPYISVIEPSTIEACQVDAVTYGVPYMFAGGIGLTMRFRILPLFVSFYGIEIQEVPSLMGYHTGYFANQYFANEWSHTVQNGAGKWSEIDYYNVTKLIDTAALKYSLPRVGINGDLTNDLTAGWIEGINVWSVPFGWRGKTLSSSELVKGFAAEETQAFVIDSQGTVQVQKLRQNAERDVFNHVYLNGEEK